MNAERTARSRDARRRREIASDRWRLALCLAPAALVLVVSDRFALSILTLAGFQALYAVSWDLLGGLSGQPSLGHALPFGAGAYLVAVAAESRAPLWSALVLGIVGGTVTGGLQGKAGRRLSPMFLVLVTFATAECAHEFSRLLAAFDSGGGLAGGGEAGLLLPGLAPEESNAARLAAATLGAGMVGLLWFARSRFGLPIRLTRSDPWAAASSGIDAARTRLVSFALAGAIAGLAGGLTAIETGRAVPPMFSVETSLFPVVASVIGGPGTFIGPALTAFVMAAGAQVLDLSGPERLAVYSLLLIVAGLISPAGLLLSGARFGGGIPWRTRSPRESGAPAADAEVVTGE